MEDDVVALFEATIARLGAVTTFVNNAGTLHAIARLDKMSVARIRDVVDVNLINCAGGR